MDSDFISGVEDVWVCNKFRLLQDNFVLCLSPRRLPVVFLCQFFIEILNFKENNSYLLCGDFNLSTITWIDNKYNFLSLSNVENKFSELVDIFTIKNCMQFNSVRNSKNRILDLILRNKFHISWTWITAPCHLSQRITIIHV